MNRLIPILTNPEYMGVAGAFLGINTGLYNLLKSEHGHGHFEGEIFFTAYTGLIGGAMGMTVGVLAPPMVPIYIASIPCYFGMKYLIKKELI